MSNPKVSFILTCAGKGARAGFNKNKLLVDMNGETPLSIVLNTLYQSNLIDQLIVTASKEDFDTITRLCAPYNVTVVLGGDTRTQSVKNALALCEGDITLIHDGARPYLTKDLIKRCIDGAIKKGGVIPVMPSRNTVVKVENENVLDYLGKGNLYSVQTPQAFKTELIKKAYEQSGDKVFNDDGEVYKEYVGSLCAISGEPNNIKLTFPEDFNFSKSDDKEKPLYRFGVGFDCHKLVEGRPLILGGIEIAHDKGLLGHSDADVLTHAIMDAMLSSVALRDIGYHFPDTDEAYKGANSIELLKKVIELVKGEGYILQSLSASIMAEKPKLLKLIPSITQNLASVLDLPIENIGITATTLEGLGFVGREEGICVHANATVKLI